LVVSVATEELGLVLDVVLLGVVELLVAPIVLEVWSGVVVDAVVLLELVLGVVMSAGGVVVLVLAVELGVVDDVLGVVVLLRSLEVLDVDDDEDEALGVVGVVDE
jgi:hypothetical protein